MNTTNNENGQTWRDIPAPADATGAPSGWLEVDEGRWWRTYTARRAVLDFPRPELPNHDGQVVIEVVGHQYSDGETVERYVHVNGGGMDELTAGQAREVAAALIAAAEELDKLNGDAPPF